MTANFFINRILLVCVIFLLQTVRVTAQYSFDGPPIHYWESTATDRVARLAARIDAGELTLQPDHQGNYLQAVLRELDIPVSSQALVFSKTSLQVHQISPETPRAIYFNDDCYVGWVQDGYMIEFGAMDDALGGVFYSMRLNGGSARLSRDRGGCIACHASQRTERVPGFFVRSIYPRANGKPREPGTVTDHRSPLETRWGGWYVTGTHGDLRHFGNTFADDPVDSFKMDVNVGANRMMLDDLCETSAYPSPHSDIVALMVLEHQAQMHNLITRANFETRKVMALADGDLNDKARDRIAVAGDALFQYMLFCDEPNLPSAIKGSSSFTEDFVARGPTNSQGQSLRDLDLQTRLFRHPCSYLVYSSAFAALPKPMLDYLRVRLMDVLHHRDSSERFAHLSVDDRNTIRLILDETKPDWL